MKARAFCILIAIIVILLLSTVAQASEYREADKEINASNILTHIEMGDDINLSDCRINGELNISTIKLKIVPNPLFYELTPRGQPKYLILYLLEETSHIDKNLHVIESNITIKNTTFEKNVDLSFAFFNNSVYFLNSTFKNPAYFSGSTFNNSINFSSSTFKKPAYFPVSTFNNSIDFSSSIFDSFAYFQGSTFNNSVYFSDSIFYNTSCFLLSNFYSSVYFSRSTFNKPAYFAVSYFYNYTDFSDSIFTDSADFSNSIFTDSADFSRSTFNKSAYFGVPDSSENVFTDGETCEFFRKSYNNLARYTDADNIYYNFRVESMNEESISISKVIDLLSCFTCGFGTKLTNTIDWITGIIILFAFVYKWDWKTPGIYRASDENKKEKSEVSFLECIAFSINTFTRLGTPNWQQSNKFWYAVTIEGFLGWIMLAIFLATLIHLLIRP
jgi:Pentapeptide repeats (9 copies)